MPLKELNYTVVVKKHDMGEIVIGKKTMSWIYGAQSFAVFSLNILGAPSGNKIVVIAEGNSI